MKLTTEQLEKLKKLAEAKGVQLSYQSAFGTVIESDPEALVVALNALGSDPKSRIQPDFSNLDAVLDLQSKELWKTMSEPVLVAWEKKPLRVPIRIHSSLVPSSKGALKIQFERQTGRKTQKPLLVPFSLARLPVRQQATLDGGIFVELELKVTKPLPWGYHSAVLSVGKKKHAFLIISAPWKAFKCKTDNRKSLGVFAPLYAVHTRNSWGMGDFSDLAQLVEWAYSMRCNFVGTLPMLSIFNDKPVVEPSPYAPLSRVFWNELYVDPRKTEEWIPCLEAQAIVYSRAFQNKLQSLRAAREVDYQAISRLKRPVFQALSEFFFRTKGHLSKSYRNFLRIYPAAEDYAAFRATLEKRNQSWRKWPATMRNGKLKPGDYRKSDQQLHLYCQYQAHLQLSALASRAAEKGRGIYIDFPLSAHADGYDVWRDRDAFAQVVSAGCPPDPAHVHGQDWGILALNPQSIRATHYRYFRRCLESHMRYAGLLRLDHVMCFYRLYWVPHGLGAKKGVYVRYKMDEFFALLVLESHRNQCALIGEDLGTVPPEIREAMTAHGILRMYVQQRKLTTNPKEPLPEVPENAICSLNTHDMPPFAAFWQGLDILDKMDLGYFGRKELPAKQKAREEVKSALIKYLFAKKMIGNRKPDFRDVLKSMLRLNAKDPVRVMQVNLEDLWEETLPQNMPGTWKERPNWKRRCRYSLDELATACPDLPELLSELRKLRQKG